MKDKEKRIFDKYGNYDFPTDIKQECPNNATSQIEEMAKDCCKTYPKCNPCDAQNCIVRQALEKALTQGYEKVGKDSVVLSREEYEKLKKQLTKARSEKKRFKNKCLALETNKEWDIAQASEETTGKILKKVKELHIENTGEEFGYDWFGAQLIKLAKQFGVEIKE